MSGQLERQQSLLTADLHKMNLDDRPDVHFSRRVSSNMNLEAIMTVQQSGDIDDDGDDWTTDGAKGSAHFRRKSVSSAAKLHMVEWSDLTGRRKLASAHTACTWHAKCVTQSAIQFPPEAREVFTAARPG